MVQSITMITSSFSDTMKSILNANQHALANLQRQLVEMRSSQPSASHATKPSFTLQQFSGTSKQRTHEFVTSWLNWWTTHFRLENIQSDDIRITMVVRELIGVANSWWECLTDKPSTWATFEDMLQHEYVQAKSAPHVIQDLCHLTDAGKMFEQYT